MYKYVCVYVYKYRIIFCLFFGLLLFKYSKLCKTVGFLPHSYFEPLLLQFVFQNLLWTSLKDGDRRLMWAHTVASKADALGKNS